MKNMLLKFQLWIARTLFEWLYPGMSYDKSLRGKGKQ
jgi:hypothetical protein